MKLPRRKSLHMAAGAVAMPAVSRNAWAQTYPNAAGHNDCAIPRGRAADTNRGPFQSHRNSDTFCGHSPAPQKNAKLLEGATREGALGEKSDG
jgi:hypothetical protein